jgi:hypothetical protein
VNFKRIYNSEDIVTEPFVLASQAQQVYYVQDPSDSDWQFVITPSTRDFYDMGIINDVD